MKKYIYLILTFMFAFSLIIYSSQYQNKNDRRTKNAEKSYKYILAKGYEMEENIIITVNGKDFRVKFYNNKTAEVLIQKLPMTINMDEMNGNEKYYFMKDNLPTSSERKSEIKTGDIMLYGNNCLVIFYKTFRSSYSYSPIGYIENTDGLTETLGRGSADVTLKKVQKI